MGNVVEEIAGGANAESLEGFGALRADAFQKLYGSVELELQPETNR